MALNEPEKEDIIRLTSDIDVVAPEILPYEIGNALSAMIKRKQTTPEEALSTFKTASMIPVRLVSIDIQQALGLEEVRLVPCNIPPHRPQPVASREQRVAMLKAAASQHPVFRVDTREFDRAGPSYTLDTLKSFRGEMGETGLCLLMGLDAFVSLPAWYHWQELIEFCHMVVMTRPGAVVPGEGELADFTERRWH